MKKIILSIFLLAGATAFAQTPKQDVELIQAAFGKEKQLIIKESLVLTDTQATVFWPIYDQYEAERQALVRERFRNIAEYAQKYGGLNEESAQKISKAILTNDEDLASLEKKYLPKVAKAIGNINALQFFQLETYIRNVIYSEVQEELPIIKSLLAD